MTTYQLLIQSHLTALLSKDDAVTTDVVFQASEKEFVKNLCLRHGYVPAFGITKGGYTTMNAIKLFVC